MCLDVPLDGMKPREAHALALVTSFAAGGTNEGKEEEDDEEEEEEERVALEATRRGDAKKGYAGKYMVEALNPSTNKYEILQHNGNDVVYFTQAQAAELMEKPNDGERKRSSSRIGECARNLMQLEKGMAAVANKHTSTSRRIHAHGVHWRQAPHGALENPCTRTQLHQAVTHAGLELVGMREVQEKTKSV